MLMPYKSEVGSSKASCDASEVTIRKDCNPDALMGFSGRKIITAPHIKALGYQHSTG
jgi:hypothetical protein